MLQLPCSMSYKFPVYKASMNSVILDKISTFHYIYQVKCCLSVTLNASQSDMELYTYIADGYLCRFKFCEASIYITDNQ